jgi:V8-like Glu-specific endopeptidase
MIVGAVFAIPVLAGVGYFVFANRPDNASTPVMTPGPLTRREAIASGDLPTRAEATSRQGPPDTGLSGEVRAPAPAIGAEEAVEWKTLSIEEIVGQSMPAVVTVETPQGRGSGFFVGSGVLLTNAHVVSGNSYVTIRSSGDVTVPARVTSSSTDVDLAVLHVDAPLPQQVSLSLGAAAEVRVGEEVIAIGSPLGFQNTVTRGIVSGIRKVGTVVLIQTDAAINPGNSGGPLIDRQGRVIGINSLKIAGRAQSIGFAIASDYARTLLQGGSPAPALPAAAPDTSPLQGAFTQKSPADERRELGGEAYQKKVAAVARRADSVDAVWAEFKAVCYSGAIKSAYDREWFALWDMRGTVNRQMPYGCGARLDEINRYVDQLRTGMIEADEDARRADVYPGTRRDVRRKYRMDWPGWERH